MQQDSKILNDITNRINSMISEVNSSFDQCSLESPSISILFNPSSLSFEFILNTTTSNSPLILTTPITLLDIDFIITFLRKTSLLNNHISFSFVDIFLENPLIEIPSTSLILPKINEVIISIGNFFSKKINEDNYVIYQYKEKDVIIELCVVFHNYLPNGSIDLMIYKDRQYQNFFDTKDIINFINDSNFCLSIDKANNATTFKKSTNISYVFVINYSDSSNSEEKKLSEMMCKALENIKEKLNNKVKIYIDNMNISLSIRTIISSLENVYHSTANQNLYNKMSLLFPEQNNHSLLEKKLYDDFISGMKY